MKGFNIDGIDELAVRQMAKGVGANCIVSIVNNVNVDEWVNLDLDVLKELDISDEEVFSIKVSKGNVIVEHEFRRKQTGTVDSLISEILADLIKNTYISQNDRVMIITDTSVSSKYNVSLFVTDVDRVSYRIGKFSLAEKMVSETVIESILEIAQEIAVEGREGKKIGALFVIGDEEELSSYTRQLIMNPFMGYKKELLDVRNINIRETLKNFAQLDGAFIVSNAGFVRSAGTYIDVDTSNVKPYAGWGTKHLSATAISKQTSAIAVLVSESGGRVKVFKNGRLVLRV